MKNTKGNRRTCRFCKNCTPYTKFSTLSLNGEPTMGTCPYWKKSKCVLLSLDTCDHFDVIDEYSAVTETVVVHADIKAKKELLSNIREEFNSNAGEILPTLPYGKEKKKRKKK